jgi:predicted transcriptional regulator
MAFPAVTIPAETTVDDAARSFFVRYRFQGFPVIGEDGVLGLVTIERVEATPAERRPTTRVGELVEDDPELFINEHADVAELLERPAFRRVGRAVVLAEHGGVGILSLTEVERALRALRLSGEQRSGATELGTS